MLALALAALLSQAAQESEAERAYDALLREQEAEQQARLATMRKVCGKDYLRIAVGMRFARVRQCTRLEFTLQGETEFGQLWEAQGGYVWVRRGKITRWLAPQP